jgi:hypothetical protein
VTTPAFEKLIRDWTDSRLALAREKGEEYANSENNRFANFERIAADLAALGLEREHVLYVYLRKHLDSIASYLANGRKRVGSEPIEGRLADMQNYLDLLAGMLADRGVFNEEIASTISQMQNTVDTLYVMLRDREAQSAEALFK